MPAVRRPPRRRDRTPDRSMRPPAVGNTTGSPDSPRVARIWRWSVIIRRTSVCPDCPAASRKAIGPPFTGHSTCRSDGFFTGTPARTTGRPRAFPSAYSPHAPTGPAGAKSIASTKERIPVHSPAIICNRADVRTLAQPDPPIKVPEACENCCARALWTFEAIASRSPPLHKAERPRNITGATNVTWCGICRPRRALLIALRRAPRWRKKSMTILNRSMKEQLESRAGSTAARIVDRPGRDGTDQPG